MYSEYNLRYNSLSESGLKFKPVDRVNARNMIKIKLDDSALSKYCQMFFLEGDYGIGKSFFLADLERRIKSENFLTGKKVLIASMNMITPKPPSNYTLYIYQEIMESLGESTFKKLLKEVEETKNEKLLKGIDPEFRSAFSFLGTIYNKIAVEFLMGKDVSPRDLSSIGVKTEIDENTALKMLSEFLKILKILNYDTLMVLIDEFEYIFTATGKQKSTQLLMTYRRIFDYLNKQMDSKDLTKIIFIFTGTPHSMEILRIELVGAEPFIQRLDEFIIRLTPFSLDETRQLLEYRLNDPNVRINKEDKEKIGIFPFKEDFVEFILNKSEGIPRRILKLSSFVIDIAYQQKIKEIGKAEAEKILMEYGKIV